ncbi:hypothetical protein SRABI81_01787 [Stenotrophomonas lactitubi]|nr:hypothetical protein SRABI81_01787 [Stenotrophomonas lactitubi]CAH0207136.1 hypothetical protein SRABI122_02070 [Stenotrophomonas lactitubi]
MLEKDGRMPAPELDNPRSDPAMQMQVGNKQTAGRYGRSLRQAACAGARQPSAGAMSSITVLRMRR